ncbi:hypothetical protein FACS1894120_6800 [Clostridia bacterium]|nr:hypothetical protein FACS1894120_6800 [Clostridia bacterium]
MNQLLAILLISALFLTGCSNATEYESAVNTTDATAETAQLANTKTTAGIQYQAFACVVDNTGKVYWKTGIDTTDAVIKEFTNAEKWKDTDSTTYPYQACAELWKRGFIASFDGENWRLSSGKDGTVVYQISAKELLGQ